MGHEKNPLSSLNVTFTLLCFYTFHITRLIAL